ncbi:MAG: hypothetical protein R3F14_21545 [Polyangiaceae bacterium]
MNTSLSSRRSVFGGVFGWVFFTVAVLAQGCGGTAESGATGGAGGATGGEGGAMAGGAGGGGEGGATGGSGGSTESGGAGGGTESGGGGSGGSGTGGSGTTTTTTIDLGAAAECLKQACGEPAQTCYDDPNCKAALTCVIEDVCLTAGATADSV